MFEEKLGGKLYVDSLEVYKSLVKILSSSGDWIHWSQCMSAAGSIAANIAEGNGKQRVGGKYYQTFLLHSRGSAYEVVAWLQMGVVDGVVSDCDASTIGAQLLDLGDRLLIEIMK